MNDMQGKSDVELRDIMRSALPNQNVPSSSYHRAKQELDFRMANKKQEEKDLSLTAKTVLRSLASSKLGTDVTGKFITIDILEHQFGEKHMSKVKDALDQLIARDLIEEVEDTEDVFRLTPFGGNYLAELTISTNVSYSNISNSNIAHESPQTHQTINIRELPDDIKNAIEELRTAAGKRDKPGIIKAFGYIADKALDVAIAIALGHLKIG